MAVAAAIGLIAAGMKHLFLSPHLDDASLSAGGYIAFLCNRGDAALVQTFVTGDVESNTALSPFADAIHRQWGLGDKPYARRREEDLRSCRVLGASYRHEGLLDGIYRADPEGSLLYVSIEALFSGRPAERDALQSEVGRLLGAQIDQFQPDRIYAPMGIGGHVDHVIVSNALRAIVASVDIDVWLYEDFPYVLGQYPQHRPDSLDGAKQRSTWRFESPVIVPIDLTRKIDAVLAYASQLEEIFIDASLMPGAVESYARSIGNGTPAERYWPVRP